jgi:hypothetical protein
MYKPQDVCPSAAKDANLYIKVLHEACLKVGGEHRLARILGVGVESIEHWLAGDGIPSESVFLKCVDIVEGE